MSIKKTENEFQIWGRNEYGFEERCAYSSRREALADLKEYQISEPSTSFSLKRARVPIRGAMFAVRFTSVGHDGTRLRLQTEIQWATKAEAREYALKLARENGNVEAPRVVIVPPEPQKPLIC